MKKTAFYPLIVLAYGSIGSFAANGQLPPMTPIAPVASIGAALVRTVGALAFVVALIFGGAWAFRNMHRLRQTGSPQRKLHVLEAKSLGARQAIYVVAFEQQRLLIGSTAQGLTLLTHLPDGAPQEESARILPVPFGEALMQALGRK